MGKIYNGFIYRCCLLVGLISFSAITVHAQNPPYFKGLGTATNTIPMNTANGGTHTQQIYQPADFNTLPISGLITKIYFRNSVAGATGTYSNFSVAFLQNSLAAFPDNTFLTGFTTALSTPSITLTGSPNAGGWYEIPLTTPFLYDNSQTLIVEIKYTARTGGITGYTTTAVGNKRLSIINPPGALTGNLSTLWGDFGMDVIPSGPCTDPPDPGLIVASQNPICFGLPFNLTLTGGTSGQGQTYQWQSSTDGSNWTNIPGANNTLLSFPSGQNVTTFYRVNITCGVTVSTDEIQMITPDQVSGTFTINNTLPTAGTNFNSFNAAYNFIRCGIDGDVVFNVTSPMGAPHNEQLIMEQIPGASAQNTVTFNGNGREIHFNSPIAAERAVIKLNGTDHVTFNDLIITADGTLDTEYGFGVHLINDADSNTFRNCTININQTNTTGNYAGIVVSASHINAIGTGNTLCDGNIFDNNTISGGMYGITLVGSTTVSIRNNQVTRNKIRDFYQYGIYVSGTFNTLIDSNQVSRPNRSSVVSFNGIYFTTVSVQATISRNTISDPFGGAPDNTAAMNGIMFNNVDALNPFFNKVYNNVIWKFNGAGDINAINNTGSDNVWYYHNTIALDGAGTPGIVRAFYQTTTAGGIEFKNNIVAITMAGTGAKYAMYYNAPTTSDVLSDYNDFYISPTATNASVGFYTTPRATLADWQAASGDDAASIITNPVFQSASNGNFRPTNASIDNLGEALGILDDITGVIRSTTAPDMGAYEFTSLPCTSPVGGNATVSATPICVNRNVSIGLAANSTGIGQTYQWQTSTTQNGTYTNIGNVLTNPDTTIVSSATLWYRAEVKCGATTVYSDPVLLTVDPALPGNTYTINKNAAPSATNFISFNAAKAAMRCGIAGPVVFNVVAGTGPYNEQLILDSIAGISATNTITFNGNGNTIAFCASDPNERAVIKLKGIDHVTFNNLTVDATGTGTCTYGFGFQLINNADSNTINECTILTSTTTTTANTHAGIVVNATNNSASTAGNTLCDGNVFSNNTINGGYHGITLVGSATVSIKDNVVINNIITDFYQFGIYVSGNYNTIIESNNISRPTRAVVGNFNGIYLTGLSVATNISKNRIHNPFGGVPNSTAIFYGIYFTGVDALSTNGLENKVFNNLIYDVNGLGTSYGLYNTSSDNVYYYHNTISIDNQSANTDAVTYGFYQTTAASGIEFKNNLISITRTGAGNKFGLYFNTATSVITSNHNNVYVTGQNSYFGFNGANRLTLANWQANTTPPQDQQSVSTIPMFTSPATGNFSPQSVVLDNRGTPVGVTNDILNAPRSATTPDIGAYEFSIPPCSAPPVAGASFAIPNSGICLGTPVNLGLTGASFGSGQTYQWQFSTTETGTYTDLGPSMQFADTIIQASFTYWYRAAVTCNGNTQFSTPVLVTVNPAFLGGVYTIDPAITPYYPGSNNFESFTTAVAQLECGITDAVTFNVAPGTYNEQIRIHAIGGSSDTKRVTFQSANGNPTSVNLTFDAQVPTANYTLKLDSASYVTFKNMTITAVNAVNGRAIEIANTASYDSIAGNIIVAPVATANANTVAGIYADLLRGSNIVISGNDIRNGASGIFFEGSTVTNLTYDNVIENNTVSGAFFNNISIGYNGRIKVVGNVVNVTEPRAATSYGIYSINSDSAFLYKANNIFIDNTTTTVYGMYFTGSNASEANMGIVANNKIFGLTGNTGNVYGMYHTTTQFTRIVNNVISINTTGATSYASYSTGSGANTYHNNTFISSATSATNNIAAYFSQTGTLSATNIQNNIFAHYGGGRAFYAANVAGFYSDYNNFYSSGATLIQWGSLNLPTLQRWRDTAYWDLNSIAIEPALISVTDPRPDLADPDVWAIHGRGTQIVGNDYDHNDNPRPTTLTTGVPDLGAYEFLPTSLPTVLTSATPPSAGGTQVFMYGTDTVARITYHPTAPVPASMTLQRYSGVLPTGLSTGQEPMYFYTDAEVPAQGAYNYTIEQFYIDPWRGFIPTEPQIKLGYTNPANEWVVSSTSTTETFTNVIRDTGLVHIDRFTGLMGDPTVSPPPPYISVLDTSNRGTRFWVPYGHHTSFTSNAQDMWLYLSAEDAARVTVRVNGTNWVRTYDIPANTVKVSDRIPKNGMIDARITDEGLFERGISITSDVPIVAYAHIFDGANSGASLLLPVGVYGYEYQSLNFKQSYGLTNAHSWFAVMTDRDSTLVEITPSQLTKKGQLPNVPFQVYLMQGEVYNVMGAQTGANGTDMTGSTVKSIANARGECYPIAVFSGSSRTSICNAAATNGDNFIQQVFPSQAWGKRYLTFSTARSTSNTQYNSNIFRVMVKDQNTNIIYNGNPVPLSSLVVPGNYYEFSTTSGTGPNGAVSIEADKPVMVAQYMVSTTPSGCPGVTTAGNGDPEMIYISPVEQGIKRIAFYNTDRSAITSNYINLVIPTGGLASLRIDNNAGPFTDVFPHPYLAGYTAVRHNLGATPGQHIVTSDSAFTAITYGLGNVESYGYNAGTLVKNLNALPAITNTLSTTGTSEYTCANAPFTFSMLISSHPQELSWNFSEISTLSPNANVVQTNPVPIDTVIRNGREFYLFTVSGNYTFSTPGIYQIPIDITDTTSIEGCDNKLGITLTVEVLAPPVADFSPLTACAGSPLTFNGTATTVNNTPVIAYNWTFGDNTTGTGQGPTHTYTTDGTYPVNLSIVSADGCVADTTQDVIIGTLGAVDVVDDTVEVCGNGTAVFEVQNPLPGSTYNWYNVATGGTPVGAGTTFTTPPVTAQVSYWVQTTSAGGCVSTRTEVVATLTSSLPPVEVVTDTIRVCGGGTATFDVQNPTAGSTYTWYTAATGGTLLFTGTSFTTPAVTGTIKYYVQETNSGGCISTRTEVVATQSANLPPVELVDATIAVCGSTTATFEILNPVTGSTYNWYSAATGGTLLFTGTIFVTPPVTGTSNFYVEEVNTGGCVSDPRTEVTATLVTSLPPVEVVSNSVQVCINEDATFTVLNPVTGSTYEWFTSATGGTAVAAGTSFTVTNVTGTVVYFVQETNAGGCVSSPRTSVTAGLLGNLAAPVVRVDSTGSTSLVFAWDAVPGAVRYEVSTDNGTTWIDPSSGPAGLSHTVTGLNPLQEVTIIVKAIGSASCQESVSQAVTGRTLGEQVFIPNTFTPNGDGLNDILYVYGQTIQSMRFMMFNQWGEKIFESTNQSVGWNGIYKGKVQPSGVYMYVCQITLLDGSKVVRKGSVNLVR